MKQSSDDVAAADEAVAAAVEIQPAASADAANRPASFAAAALLAFVAAGVLPAAAVAAAAYQLPEAGVVVAQLPVDVVAVAQLLAADAVGLAVVAVSPAEVTSSADQADRRALADSETETAREGQQQPQRGGGQSSSAVPRWKP